MGSRLSLEAADRKQSDVSPPITTTSKAHENHHNTKIAVSTTRTRSKNLPHEVEAILKDADTDIDKSSIDKLYAGVYLNKKKRKYWVDKASNGNCFLVFARDLSITWGDDTRYWRWPCIKDTSEGVLDVAELINVCYLDINLYFEISLLTPGLKYEVVFVVKMNNDAYGWQDPIYIALVLPDGTSQKNEVNMMEKPRSEWFEIPVGEFMVEARKRGLLNASIYLNNNWKRGLVLKCVAIRTKN